MPRGAARLPASHRHNIVAGEGNRTGKVSHLEIAVYGLGAFGSVLFILACFLHSIVIGAGGIALIVSAVLLGARIYMMEMTKETRLLSAASAAWAILFASWLVLAVLLPAGRPAAPVPGGPALVGCWLPPPLPRWGGGPNRRAPAMRLA